MTIPIILIIAALILAGLALAGVGARIDLSALAVVVLTVGLLVERL